MMDSLDEQGVIIIGIDAIGLVIPPMVRQLFFLHARRADLATHLEAIVETHPNT